MPKVAKMTEWQKYVQIDADVYSYCNKKTCG